MSKWRRIALDKMPMCKEAIEKAENVTMLWFDLKFILGEAYAGDSPNEELIAQIYELADWCSSDEAGKAMNFTVACSFYAHLPDNGKVLLDLPNRLSRQEFLGLQDIFRRHITDDEFRRFERNFLSHSA